MAVPAPGAAGGRDGGPPVTGTVRDGARRQPAVRRKVQRRSCQPGDVRVPPTTPPVLRLPGHADPRGIKRRPPRGALRAPLKPKRKVVAGQVDLDNGFQDR